MGDHHGLIETGRVPKNAMFVFVKVGGPQTIGLRIFFMPQKKGGLWMAAL